MEEGDSPEGGVHEVRDTPHVLVPIPLTKVPLPVSKRSGKHALFVLATCRLCEPAPTTFHGI